VEFRCRSWIMGALALPPRVYGPLARRLPVGRPQPAAAGSMLRLIVAPVASQPVGSRENSRPEFGARGGGLRRPADWSTAARRRPAPAAPDPGTPWQNPGPRVRA